MTRFFEQAKADDPNARFLSQGMQESSSLNLLSLTSRPDHRGLPSEHAFPAQHARSAEHVAGAQNARPTDHVRGVQNARAAQHGRPANDAVMHVLKTEVDHHMGQTPDWVPKEMRYPSPRVQCASTASNIYREAMLASHVIDSRNSPKYRDLTQVQVPNWSDAMKDAGLAQEIPRNQIRPGDVVVGIGGIASKPENNDRHMGFVGDYDARTHRFSAYSNSMGRLREQDLDDRFGYYREEHFYRIYLPR